MEDCIGLGLGRKERKRETLCMAIKQNRDTAFAVKLNYKFKFLITWSTVTHHRRATTSWQTNWFSWKIIKTRIKKNKIFSYRNNERIITINYPSALSLQAILMNDFSSFQFRCLIFLFKYYGAFRSMGRNAMMNDATKPESETSN